MAHTKDFENGRPVDKRPDEDDDDDEDEEKEEDDEEDTRHRLRQYEISAQALPFLFRTGNVVEIIDGMPSGAEVVDAGYDYRNQVFYLTVEHESFEEVYEAEPIPQGQIEIEEQWEYGEE